MALAQGWVGDAAVGQVVVLLDGGVQRPHRLGQPAGRVAGEVVAEQRHRRADTARRLRRAGRGGGAAAWPQATAREQGQDGDETGGQLPHGGVSWRALYPARGPSQRGCDLWCVGGPLPQAVRPRFSLRAACRCGGRGSFERPACRLPTLWKPACDRGKAGADLYRLRRRPAERRREVPLDDFFEPTPGSRAAATPPRPRNARARWAICRLRGRRFRVPTAGQPAAHQRAGSPPRCPPTW